MALLGSGASIPSSAPLNFNLSASCRIIDGRTGFDFAVCLLKPAGQSGTVALNLATFRKDGAL